MLLDMYANVESILVNREISSDSEDDLPSFLPFLRRGLSPLPNTSTPSVSPISQPVPNQVCLIL